MLSDDPVDLRGHGGGQAGRELLGGGDEALEFVEPALDDATFNFPDELLGLPLAIPATLSGTAWGGCG